MNNIQMEVDSMQSILNLKRQNRNEVFELLNNIPRLNKYLTSTNELASGVDPASYIFNYIEDNKLVDSLWSDCNYQTMSFSPPGNIIYPDLTSLYPISISYNPSNHLTSKLGIDSLTELHNYFIANYQSKKDIAMYHKVKYLNNEYDTLKNERDDIRHNTINAYKDNDQIIYIAIITLLITVYLIRYSIYTIIWAIKNYK